MTEPMQDLRPRGRHHRSQGWRSRDVVRTAVLVIAIYLALQLFWVARALFIAVFLGVLFGIAVSGGTDRLQKWRIPRGVGAPLIVISFFGLLVGFGAWMAPTLHDQGAELRVKLPEAVDRVEEWINRRQHGVIGSIFNSPGNATATTKGATASASGKPAAISPAVRPPAGSVAATTATTASPASPDTVARLSDALHSSIRKRMNGASQYFFPFVTHTVEILGGLLLIIFLSIYFAIDPGLYRRGMLALIPTRSRDRAGLAMSRVAQVLRKWLVTQLIAMVVMAIASTIMLLLFHVKAAFALGLLAGLFEFIPTIGPILSALPGVAMGFLDSPEKAGALALAYWGLQFMESHLLIPLLMKQGIHLPPALTVVTQAMLAIVFGFLGLMVAVPVLATVTVLVKVFYLEPMPRRGASHAPRHHPDLDEDLGGHAAAAG